MNPQNLHAHEDRLLDFAYGELPVPDAQVVEAHVQGCARCAQALREIRGVRATMSQLSTEPAPDAGLESLLAYAQQAARRAAAGPAPKPSRWRRWLLPVVGLASVSTFGILTLQAKSPELTRPDLSQAQVVAKKDAPAAPAPSAPEASLKLALPPQRASAKEPAPRSADSYGMKAGSPAQPPRAENWESSGSGGGIGSRDEAKAKRELSPQGTERARGGMAPPLAKKPAPSKGAPAEKADRDEEALAEAEVVAGVPEGRSSKKLEFMQDSLKVGGTAEAMEFPTDDKTADGLTAPDAEPAPALAEAPMPAPAGPAATAAAVAPERDADFDSSFATKESRKKQRKPASVSASTAPAMPAPAPAPQTVASREPGPSVSQLSRQAQAAYRAGDRALEASLLRSALAAGASGAERWDLLNRLCDAELSLGRQAAGAVACNQVMSEAPESSAAQSARRRLSREAGSPAAPAK
jgi:hypothetical protein